MQNIAQRSPMDLFERVQIFQEKLSDILSLDGLISLSCSVLDASLYISDHNGVLLGHSADDPRACVKWRQSIEMGHMNSRETLKSILVPKPMCNIMPEPVCQDRPCARLSFPMQIGEAGHPGVLLFFFWAGMPSSDEQYLATMIAGTFAHYLKNRHILGDPQVSKIQLFKELLQYKPGLKSYYESCIAMEQLTASGGAFRLLRIPLDEARRSDAATLVLELQVHVRGAWFFAHQDNILVFFKERSADPSDLCMTLEPLLREMGVYGCMSLDFTDLLEMRHIFEDIGAVCQIAHAKKPDAVIFRAEQYLSTAFLHKCRQHFSLNLYYPERFVHLIELDRAGERHYLTTLRAYLENGLNVNATAKALYLHRSTVTQQLERIQEVLGLDLKDSEVGWYLQLCLRIHDLLNV